MSAQNGEREIPVNNALHDLLRSFGQDNFATLGSKHAFCIKDGDKLRTKLREKPIKIGQQAGIENLTRLYILRHIYANHLVMQGVDLPAVMKLMG